MSFSSKSLEDALGVLGELLADGGNEVEAVAIGGGSLLRAPRGIRGANHDPSLQRAGLRALFGVRRPPRQRRLVPLRHLPLRVGEPATTVGGPSPAPCARLHLTVAAPRPACHAVSAAPERSRARCLGRIAWDGVAPCLFFAGRLAASESRAPRETRTTRRFGTLCAPSFPTRRSWCK